jgi:predicted  nucleic acid-binding Zn-ribbon protein
MRGVGILLGAAFLLAGCGGSGGSSSQLSADAYRAQLVKIKQQSNQAQAQVAKGLSAKTIADLRSKLDAFASESQRISDEVASLDAPKNAEAANAELAQGEHDTATATHAASAAIAKMKTPHAALAYLQSQLGNAKGGHELDDAITKLKKLGYTSGS